MEPRNIHKKVFLSSTSVRDIAEELRHTGIVVCGLTNIKLRVGDNTKLFFVENEAKTERCLLIDKRNWGSREVFLLERKVWVEFREINIRRYLGQEEVHRDEVVIGRNVIRSISDTEWEFKNLPFKEVGEFPLWIPVDFKHLTRLLKDRGI